VEERDYTILQIITADSWRAGASTNGLVEIGPEGIRLTSEAVLGLEKRLGLSGRVVPTDLAADRSGVLTLLAGESLYRFDPHTGLLEPIACLGGAGREVGRLLAPRRLAVGRRNLYVADTGNNRVYALARSNFQVRWLLGATAADGAPVPGTGPGAFNGPTDLAVDRDGQLYVLDAGNRRIQKFDESGGTDASVPPFGADHLVNPIVLVGGAEGGAVRLHCLDAGLGAIVTFDAVGGVVSTVALGGLGFPPGGLAVDEEGKFYVPGPGRLISVVRADGTATPLEEYEGEAGRIVSGPGGTLYAIEPGDIALLTRRRRYPPAWTASGAATGIYLSAPFDSRDDRQLWHRITLATVIPEKTQVRLSYFIYPPGQDPAALPADSEWRPLAANPADALLERKEGRHLRVRLELISEDRHATPEVRGMRLFFPKRSYLRYLPAVYQEDEAGRDFLERFLSLYESVFLDLEGELFRTERFCDPWAAPVGVLPWLASWLALAYREDWPEAAVRALIAEAHQLYRRRGTRQGLCDLIALYAGKTPWIVEPLQLDCLRDADAPAKEEWLRLFDDDPYAFTVFLPPDSRGRRETVTALVDQERPAHTCARVVLLENFFRLGMHSYLEVNTTLREPVFTLETSSSVSRETYLADREEGGQLEVRARLAIDTMLT
jgi:phage tail-like protein